MFELPEIGKKPKLELETDPLDDYDLDPDELETDPLGDFDPDPDELETSNATATADPNYLVPLTIVTSSNEGDVHEDEDKLKLEKERAEMIRKRRTRNRKELFKFECRPCNLKFQFHKKLETHNERAHGIKSIYYCIPCGSKFTRRSLFTRTRHCDIYRVKTEASFCYKRQRSNVANGIGNKHPEENQEMVHCEPLEEELEVCSGDQESKKTAPTFVCMICCLSLNSPSDLEITAHMYSHSLGADIETEDSEVMSQMEQMVEEQPQPISQLFCCHLCQVKFELKSSLDRHFRAKHVRINEQMMKQMDEILPVPMPIPMCMKIEKQLENPVPIPQLFRCKICDRAYQTKTGLTYHVSSKHDYLPISAPVPPLETVDKDISSLGHSDSKIPKLPIRLLGSKSSSSLLMPKEPKQTKLACELCQKTFITLSALVTHLRNIHSDSDDPRYQGLFAYIDQEYKKETLKLEKETSRMILISKENVQAQVKGGINLAHSNLS